MKILCTGYGSNHTNKYTRQAYDTISMSEVWNLVLNPLPPGEKENAQWVIPSAYHEWDAREFEVQREHGKYETFLCWDIDSGNHEKEFLADAVRKVLGEGVAFAIYSTQSSRPYDPVKDDGGWKWRVLTPLHDSIALSGAGYFAYQTSCFGELEEYGIKPDYAPARTAQLIYLPTRGEYYDHHFEPGKPFYPYHNQKLHDKAGWINSAAKDAAKKRQAETSRSILGAFRRKHPTRDLMIAYGFETQNGVTWKSPGSESGSYGGTRLYEDEGTWYSSANSMHEIGRATSKGGTHGDGFDLYIHFTCGGDRKAAEDYARLCLAEEDANRYGVASTEHGKIMWAGCAFVSGVSHGFSPAGLEACRVEEERAIAEAFASAEAVVSQGYSSDEGNNEEWDMDWPPGLVGELAQWIYAASSRPIKQFSIAAAIYFFSVVGRKYNLQGAGLNVYLMLVAKTGRGKGVVKSAVDKMVSAIELHNQDPMLALPFSHEVSVSQAGLHKAMTIQNPLCAYEEELGSTLVPLGKPNASENSIALRKIITKLFDSGESSMIGTRQASKEADTKGVVAMPTFTLAGDTQPHIFRQMLGNQAVDSGFAPRMVPFFFNGERSYHNKESEKYQTPPASLVAALSIPLKHALRSSDVVHQIEMDADAQVLYEDLDRRITDVINKPNSVGVDLYNRVNAIVLRFAGIFAVGVNYSKPVVTAVLFEYAEKLVMSGMDKSLKILNAGGGGEGEDVRQYHIRKAAEDFMHITNPDSKIKSYKMPKSMVDMPGIINDRYFIIKLKNVGDFAATVGSMTTEQNIRNAIEEAVRQDVLVEFMPVVPIPRSKQRYYQLGDAF